MSDDFYKKKFTEDDWLKSSTKEKRVARMITEGTKKTVNLVGFGAGETGYITGSAADHGIEKSFPDLAIQGTNVFIEVTGPLTSHVGPLEPLWIRPGKIDFAYDHYDGEMDIWLVHHIVKGDLFRVIHFNNEFLEALDNDEFQIVKPIVRGSRTTFISIDSDHATVEPWERFIRYINNCFPYREDWRI